MVGLQYLREPDHFPEHRPADVYPGNLLRLTQAFAADMNNIVLDLSGAELSMFAFRLVAANRIGGNQNKASLKQRLQNIDPGFISAMVKGKGQRATRLENSMSIQPAGSQSLLIKFIGRRPGGSVSLFLFAARIRVLSAIGDSL